MKTGTDGSVQIQESTEGGMEIIKLKKRGRRNQQGKKAVGCQTGVEAPRPSRPPLSSETPPPPLPPPPWPRGGVDMGAGWGGDEKKTQHTRMEAELLT